MTHQSQEGETMEHTHGTNGNAAKDCPCCTALFEKFEQRLREAVQLFEADLSGEQPEERQRAVSQASQDVERIIAEGWGE